MKVDLAKQKFLEWFIVVAVSSDKIKFQQLTENDWHPENVDFKVVVNGIEFEKLEDLFSRIQDHIQETAEEIALQDKLVAAKLHAIQDIIHAQSLEELEGWK